MTYIGTEKFPSGSGEVNLISPLLNVPFNNARWDLYLPPDYDYQQFAGSMAHEAQAAPAVQSYSLSEYHAQEAQQKAAKQAATTSVDIPLYISDNRKAARTFQWAPRRSVRIIVDEINSWLKDNEADLKPLFL